MGMPTWLWKQNSENHMEPTNSLNAKSQAMNTLVKRWMGMFRFDITVNSDSQLNRMCLWYCLMKGCTSSQVIKRLADSKGLLWLMKCVKEMDWPPPQLQCDLCTLITPPSWHSAPRCGQTNDTQSPSNYQRHSLTIEIPQALVQPIITHSYLTIKHTSTKKPPLELSRGYHALRGPINVSALATV